MEEVLPAIKGRHVKDELGLILLPLTRLGWHNLISKKEASQCTGGKEKVPLESIASEFTAALCGDQK